MDKNISFVTDKNEISLANKIMLLIPIINGKKTGEYWQDNAYILLNSLFMLTNSHSIKSINEFIKNKTIQNVDEAFALSDNTKAKRMYATFCSCSKREAIFSAVKESIVIFSNVKM